MSELEPACQVYSRLLLPKGEGAPLWFPEPNQKLPKDYRKDGVRVGDVGILASNGTFDYLFNICAPADDPINQNRVPDGFEDISGALRPDDYAEYPAYRYPGTHVASNVTMMNTIRAGGSVTSTSVAPVNVALEGRFHFTSSTTEGAVLVLPDGSSKTDLTNTKPLREQAFKHASVWDEYARQTRGREFANGSLFLATGFEKATSWGLASFSNISNGVEISLDLKVAEALSGRLSYAYEWEISGSPDSRVDPVSVQALRFERSRRNRPTMDIKLEEQFCQPQSKGDKHNLRDDDHKAKSNNQTDRKHHHFQSEGHIQGIADLPDDLLDLTAGTGKRLNNQCIFVRGFRISIRERFKLFTSKVQVTVSDAGQSGETKNVPRPSGRSLPPPSISGTTGQGDSSGSASKTKNASGQPQGEVAEECANFEVLGSDTALESVPKISQLHDPLQALNNWLFDMIPDAQIAVTHDQDFWELLHENEEIIPPLDEIIRRASNKFKWRIAPRGRTVFIQEDKSKSSHRSELSLSEKTVITEHNLSPGRLARPLPPNESLPRVRTNTTTCSSCLSQNESGALCCTGCGESLPGPPLPAPHSSETLKRSLFEDRKMRRASRLHKHDPFRRPLSTQLRESLRVRTNNESGALYCAGSGNSLLNPPPSAPPSRPPRNASPLRNVRSPRNASPPDPATPAPFARRAPPAPHYSAILEADLPQDQHHPMETEALVTTLGKPTQKMEAFTDAILELLCQEVPSHNRLVDIPRLKYLERAFDRQAIVKLSSLRPELIVRIFESLGFEHENISSPPPVTDRSTPALTYRGLLAYLVHSLLCDPAEAIREFNSILAQGKIPQPPSWLGYTWHMERSMVLELPYPDAVAANKRMMSELKKDAVMPED